MLEEFTPYECRNCGEGRVSCICRIPADVFEVADMEWKNDVA